MNKSVQTRGGVFGPGGYGGGIFDGSNMGFGGLGATYEQAAAGIGAAAGLGAAPNVVCIYMPYECKNWSQYDSDTQQQILAQANLVNSQFQSQVYAYKAEGACDGTRAGRMSGALKEELIAKGGDPKKMDPDPEVFGDAECKEWWRVFQRAPTVDDAKKLFGSQQLGPLKVTLDTICSGNVTVPTCKEPVVVPTPPPQVVCPPGEERVNGACQPVAVVTPPKSGLSTAWIVGGLAAAALVGGVAIAAKKKKRHG